MAAIVSPRAMAQQHLHPFFTGQRRELQVIVPGRTEREEPQQHSKFHAEGQTENRADSPSLDLEAVDIEEDPNHDRRKRQRTESPSVGVSMPESSSEHHHGVLVQSIPSSETGSVHFDMTNNSIHEPDVEIYEGRTEQQITQLDGHDDVGDDQSGKTPKKPVMKLRADGKLKSPSSIDSKGETKMRRKRRSAGKRGKVLVLKYGRTPHERLARGRKLESILSGKTRVQLQSEQKTHIESAVTTKSIREDGVENVATTCRKATHPFFLGPQKKENSKLVKGVTATSSSEAQEQQKHEGSLKTAATSWPAGFGSSLSKPMKILGAIQPIWPPLGMQHVRGLSDSVHETCQFFNANENDARKQKGKEKLISVNEEIYNPQREIVRQIREMGAHKGADSTFGGEVTAPRRLLLTGLELQEEVRRKLQITDPALSHRSSDRDMSFLSLASVRMFAKIRTSLSVFDDFDGDSQDWCHKYAPQRTEDVLQDQQDLSILRDWILAMNIDQVDTGLKQGSGRMDLKKQLAAKRRKRKVREELDDFIVSSGDEEERPEGGIDAKDATGSRDLDSASTPSTLKRLKPGSFGKTKAVVISGPSGCGKTAAVYAITNELGYEVFEINAGSRRNGRDLMDRVGDMTQNHLVHRNEDEPNATEDEKESSDKEAAHSDKGVAAFFAPAGLGASKGAQSRKKAVSNEANSKPRKQQKQSLILLEEVDILFEEDLPFWSAVFALIVQSKRPIVMTCSDEGSLPLEDFVDTAILRFCAPTRPVISEYLLAMAANEGHLLDYAAVRNCIDLRSGDLRGAINDLQFWCQMAVGDDKYGIAWFLDGKSANKGRPPNEPRMRIVSESTIQSSCFLFQQGHECKNGLSNDARLLEEAYAVNQYDPAEIDYEELEAMKPPIESRELYNLLILADSCYDALSASDISLLSPSNLDVLDCTQPDISTKMRAQHLEGYPLLQADISEDITGTSSDISFFVRASARYQLHGQQHIEDQEMIYGVLQPPPTAHHQQIATKLHSNSGFELLIEPIDGSPWNPTPGPGLSVLHGPPRTIAVEVAPTIRSIIMYDIELEKERTRLSDALTEPGKDIKRQRRTRAARAALEGGSKASTRRERWWNRNLDYNTILKTASHMLNDATLKTVQAARLQSSHEENPNETGLEASRQAAPSESRDGSVDVPES